MQRFGGVARLRRRRKRFQHFGGPQAVVKKLKLFIINKLRKIKS